MIGSFIGSFGGGLTCEYFGRKRAMMIENLIVTCGYVCIWLSNDIPLLFLGRFLTGYANGSNKPSILPYTSEVCQPRLRKFTGTLFVTSYTSGYALMYILGAFLNWRTISAILSLWPFLSFMLLFLCPESPSWLLGKGREKEAFKALFKIRGDRVVVENEMKVMADNINKQKSNNQNKDGSKFSFSDSKFFKGTFIRPFLTLVVMYTFGINYTGAPTLGFYLIHILKRGKVPIDPYVAAAWLVTWRVVLTIIASLFLAPFLPRRKLYITSGIVLATGGLSFGVVSFLDKYEFYQDMLELYPGLRWLPFISIGTLYTGLSGGFVMITFAVIGELLPSNARAIGTGLVSAISTLSFFLIVKFTPFLLEVIDLSGLLWGFGFVAYSLVVFAYFCLPETFGKTLVDIETRKFLFYFNKFLVKSSIDYSKYYNISYFFFN